MRRNRVRVRVRIRVSVECTYTNRGVYGVRVTCRPM